MATDDVLDYLCHDLPGRPSRQVARGVWEWDYAETAAFKRFHDDFLDRHKGGIVVNQLNYRDLGTPSDPGIQFVLDAMQIYFRNWWSRSGSGNEGKHRKPDGMGIAAKGRRIEIIEVKPFRDYDDGVAQLDDMIGIVQGGLAAYYQEEQLRGEMPRLNPLDVTVLGSPWKPSRSGLVVPLIATNPNVIEWICFKPTKRRRPNGAAPRDGVILYEIHTLDKLPGQPPRIPLAMAGRLAQAHASRMRSKGPPLVSWAATYVRSNASDATLLRSLLLSVGAGAAVGLVATAIIQTGGCWVMPPGSETAHEELSAAESAEALVEMARGGLIQ